MPDPNPAAGDLTLELLRRFQQEGVDYVLVGGQAVRLNGFVRATEDVDVLLKPGRSNGERTIRALGFLASSAELDPAWFEPAAQGEVENIRVADDLLVDLLFAANGETFESLQPFVRELQVEAAARPRQCARQGTSGLDNSDGLPLSSP